MSAPQATAVNLWVRAMAGTLAQIRATTDICEPFMAYAGVHTFVGMPGTADILPGRRIANDNRRSP